MKQCKPLYSVIQCSKDNNVSLYTSVVRITMKQCKPLYMYVSLYTSVVRITMKQCKPLYIS